MSLPSEVNYEPWVDEMYLGSTDERVELIQELLTKFSKLGSEAKHLSDSMIDTGLFQKPILLSHVYFTSKGSQKPGTVALLKLPVFTLGMKHKELPMIVAITGKIPRAESMKISDIKFSMGIPQVLSYTETLSRMSVVDKDELKDIIIDGIRTYRPAKKVDEKQVLWFSDYLEDNNDWNFLGFVANLPYLNVDKDTGDTRNFWIHPWGTPQLLFSHKRLPAIMIAGPSVRLDENVLGDSDMTGFTG